MRWVVFELFLHKLLDLFLLDGVQDFCFFYLLLLDYNIPLETVVLAHFLFRDRNLCWRGHILNLNLLNWGIRKLHRGWTKVLLVE